jgi:hypothetical protein
VEQEFTAARAIPALRSRHTTADAAATAALPMIRDEVASTASVPGAAPVALTVSVPRPGGRRRAPEDADIQVVAASEVSVPPGRHRAGRDEGRHRAADTEVFAAVADEIEQVSTVSAASVEPIVVGAARRGARPHGGAGWSVPQARAARPEESYGRPEVCAGRTEAEPELLTRPMRLGDLSPSAPPPGGWLPLRGLTSAGRSAGLPVGRSAAPLLAAEAQRR